MIGLDIKIQISNRKTELYFSILNFAVSKAIWNTFCIILMVYKVLGFSQDFRTCLCIVLVIRHISIHWPLKLEKVMAPHSSTLACKTPGTEEPGRLQSMGSRRVGQDWATSLSLFTFMHWRRKWQPTPVFLPGGSQGRWSLVGCHLWGPAESDTTEAT